MTLGGFKISFCNPSDLKQLTKLLDEEFVFSRNRKISLSLRFKGLLSPNKCKNILLGKIGEEIVSSLVIKPFKYFLEGTIFKGAMLGCVFTAKNYRGRGFAKSLVGEANKLLEKRKFDFGVLWTTIPEFYKKNGWFELDNGFFGVLKKEKIERKKLDYTVELCPRRDLGRINLLQRKNSSHILRDLEVYSNLPLAIIELRIINLFLGNKFDGYIIFGKEKEKNEAYVYEVFSKSKNYDSYLDFLFSGKFSNVFINSYDKDDFKVFLDKAKFVEWEKQNLRMFKIINKKMGSRVLKKIHIQFFDKI